MRFIRSLAVSVALVLAVAAPVAHAAGPYRDQALGALSWIVAQQQPDGGFPGFSAATTAEVVYAMCAVGGDPNGFLQQGRSPISYLAAHVAELSVNSGSASKAVLAVVCAGKDPRNFAGVDLLAVVEEDLTLATGQYGYDLATHSFALLTLAATGRPIPPAALSWLRQAQTPEGGWTWLGDPTGGGSDTNSTALALQALVAAGVAPTDAAIKAGLAYLHTQQNADGGFPYAKPSPYGSNTDADSTAYVIQALVAAGENPEGSDWTVDGKTPLTALLALQLPSGALEWQAGTGENSLATYQAVPALMLKSFPLARTAAGGPPALLPETGAFLALPAGLAAAAGLSLGLVLRRLARRPR